MVWSVMGSNETFLVPEHTWVMRLAMGGSLHSALPCGRPHWALLPLSAFQRQGGVRSGLDFGSWDLLEEPAHPGPGSHCSDGLSHGVQGAAWGRQRPGEGD